jgi:deoxyribodipyrimidine photolyase-related protein
MHDKNTIAMPIGILFPHQLFEQNILMEKCATIYLIEEYLFLNNIIFINKKIHSTGRA